MSSFQDCVAVIEVAGVWWPECSSVQGGEGLKINLPAPSRVTNEHLLPWTSARNTLDHPEGPHDAFKSPVVLSHERCPTTLSRGIWLSSDRSLCRTAASFERRQQMIALVIMWPR